MGRVAQRGFTLLELLTAVLVAALVLGIGVPSFGEFRRNARLTAVANDLLTAVQFARAEAVKRQLPVSLCASAEPAAAQPECSDDGQWLGWIVFADPDGDCERTAEEPLLRQAAALPGSEAARLSAAGDGTCLSFGGRGFVRSLEPAAPERVLICDTRGIGSRATATARGLTVSPTGRAAVTRDAGLLKGWDLSCPAAS
jgi:type IV fimbrial biogenesis protein FimT